MAVKSFIVQAPGERDIHRSSYDDLTNIFRNGRLNRSMLTLKMPISFALRPHKLKNDLKKFVSRFENANPGEKQRGMEMKLN
jgi:hypothetical protein